ncbi:DUF3078 domain-containing protein [Chitinophaga japonensis]|uniref:DUF3078 family protein n=1 Tax=Chitinophaga japonensis TaxID=104662 RepID=A0A562TED2_CHIJA|nr:DUF3078 domain-containing protein [Chitinophaga japonensis]TWI91340.1 Protein of unknown function (DUF3078) [Chitinophaga japonensis]
MKPIVLFLLCTLAGMSATHAQEWRKEREEVEKRFKTVAEDTAKARWRKGGIFNVNINQGSLTNWAAGGDKFSFSLASTFTGYIAYREGRRSWDNVLDLAYGYVNTTSLGGRKSDDRIDFTSKYGYDIGKKWFLSVLLNLRTQFTNGYLYDSVPPRLTSRFFSPAYVLLAPGFDYKPNDELSVFMTPISSRWVLVMDDMLSSQGAYGVDTGKHVLYQLGAYVSVNWAKEIMKDITFKTRLDLFSDYRHNPQNIDVFMTNMLNLKVNKYISANVNVDLIYDDDVREFVNSKTGVKGPRLQVKQVIGVGFSARF